MWDKFVAYEKRRRMTARRRRQRKKTHKVCVGDPWMKILVSSGSGRQCPCLQLLLLPNTADWLWVLVPKESLLNSAHASKSHRPSGSSPAWESPGFWDPRVSPLGRSHMASFWRGCEDWRSGPVMGQHTAWHVLRPGKTNSSSWLGSLPHASRTTPLLLLFLAHSFDIHSYLVSQKTTECWVGLPARFSK